MAIFGVPVSHEDDALRAVRAVAEIRDRLTALGQGMSVALSFRTGVNRASRRGRGRDAYEWHPRTLALVGKAEEARESAATALAIYEAKGDVPASTWARELVASLAG